MAGMEKKALDQPDGWTVGNEPAVVLDFTGAENYAKPS